MFSITFSKKVVLDIILLLALLLFFLLLFEFFLIIWWIEFSIFEFFNIFPLLTNFLLFGKESIDLLLLFVDCFLDFIFFISFLKFIFLSFFARKFTLLFLLLTEIDFLRFLTFFLIKTSLKFLGFFLVFWKWIRVLLELFLEWLKLFFFDLDLGLLFDSFLCFSF